MSEDRIRVVRQFLDRGKVTCSSSQVTNGDSNKVFTDSFSVGSKVLSVFFEYVMLDGVTLTIKLVSRAYLV